MSGAPFTLNSNEIRFVESCKKIMKVPLEIWESSVSLSLRACTAGLSDLVC